MEIEIGFLEPESYFLVHCTIKLLLSSSVLPHIVDISFCSLTITDILYTIYSENIVSFFSSFLVFWSWPTIGSLRFISMKASKRLAKVKRQQRKRRNKRFSHCNVTIPFGSDMVRFWNKLLFVRNGSMKPQWRWDVRSAAMMIKVSHSFSIDFSFVAPFFADICAPKCLFPTKC